jgi:hypothetical protein
MSMKEYLEIIANFTAILTFVGALGAWCYYQYGLRHKRQILEECLEKHGVHYQKADGQLGEFNFMYITTYTGMTEAEIIQASFRSDHIIRSTENDIKGYAKQIRFQYSQRSVKELNREKPDFPARSP